MRWCVVALLLIGPAGLAGCAEDGGDPNVIEFRPTMDRGSPAPKLEYRFVLYGEPDMGDSREARNITVWLSHNGQIMDFVDYSAMPQGERERLRIYKVPEGEIYFKVIAEKNEVMSGSLMVEECQSRRSDAVVFVGELKYGYGDRNIRLEYGCTR